MPMRKEDLNLTVCYTVSMLFFEKLWKNLCFVLFADGDQHVFIS